MLSQAFRVVSGADPASRIGIILGKHSCICAIVSGSKLRGLTVSEGEQQYSGVSSEAVAKATGRDWDQWLEFLDGLGAADLSHKEIVALVAGPGELDNGWWQQSVTVGYEQARGLRVIGQTSTAGFQIGVQKTLPVPVEAAWRLVADAP